MYHILLIEDDFAFANLVRKILELNDFHVTYTHNGISGIQAAQRLQPQLILVDDSLPDLDGIKVASRLRDLSVMDSIPIVAMTACPSKGLLQNAMRSGCRDVIIKPIDILEFPRQIASYFEATAATGT